MECLILSPAFNPIKMAWVAGVGRALLRQSCARRCTATTSDAEKPQPPAARATCNTVATRFPAMRVRILALWANQLGPANSRNPRHFDTIEGGRVYQALRIE